MADELQVGQEVWVHDQLARRDRGAERGTVVKIGRKLFTVRCGMHERVFRIDTGQLNDKDYSYRAFVRTDEEEDLAKRNSAAWATLSEYGLFSRRASLSLETLESIAAVLTASGASAASGKHNAEVDTAKPEQ